MATEIHTISYWRLILSFLPLLVVLIFFFWHSIQAHRTAYATFRMLVQLLILGFVLKWLFGFEHQLVTCVILLFMLSAASWIALHPVKNIRNKLFFKALLSLTIGCIPTLIIVVLGVIQLDPWNQPIYLIPLAGMIFANSMNVISLFAERVQKEFLHDQARDIAWKNSIQAALIPLTNNFFAIGLVSLPGLMTGQILSGVDPLLAVRYQIMIMASLYGAAGISVIVFSKFFIKHHFRSN